ncbi:MAG: hypothetical protein WBD55_12060, partial [Dehalococcoidia bacterium]
HLHYYKIGVVVETYYNSNGNPPPWNVAVSFNTLIYNNSIGGFTAGPVAVMGLPPWELAGPVGCRAPRPRWLQLCGEYDGLIQLGPTGGFGDPAWGITAYATTVGSDDIVGGGSHRWYMECHWNIC